MIRQAVFFTLHGGEEYSPLAPRGPRSPSLQGSALSSMDLLVLLVQSLCVSLRLELVERGT